MDIIDIIDSTDSLTYDQSFDFALQCSKLLLGSNSEKDLARRIVIHILNKWNMVPKETYPIWTDLAETIGFYPYIEKNKSTMELNSFSDEVRQKSYLSDYLPNIYMHGEQKKLSDYLSSDRKSVV
jgi:hypothetical protein